MKKNQKPDIILCLPSYNEQDSIAKVVKIVDKGLQEIYNPQKCLIVNFDSDSQDQTEQVFLKTKTVCPKKYLNTGSNPRGKGKNLLKLFKLVVDLDAKYAATIDSDITSAGGDWPRLLLEPIIKRGCDYVVPVYARSRYDGTITINLAYPIIYAVFGADVKQPIGGEFGVSRRLCQHYIKQPIIPATYQYGIDIFMTTHAVGGGFRIIDSFLGRKMHKPSFPKLVPMFKQVFASAVQSSKIYYLKKKKTKPKIILNQNKSGIDKKSAYPNKQEVNFLLNKLQKQVIRNKKEYQKFLGDEFKPVFEMINKDKRIMTAEQWTDILATLLKYCYKKTTNQKSINCVAELLLPLYMWRAVSFWDTIIKLTPADIDKLVIAQAKLLRKKLL